MHPENSSPGADEAAAGAEKAQSGQTTRPNDSNTPRRTEALRLIAAGIPVFPCASNKRPRTTRGFLDASLDPAAVDDWWQKWPDSLIGVPTGMASGLWVADADIDTKTGLQVGDATLGGYLETAAYPHRVTTPSGGAHYLFRWAPALPKNSVKKLEGVDVRGEGGYIIAWDPRVIIGARNDIWLTTPPTRLVDALLEATGRRRTGSASASGAWARKALEDEADQVRRATPGSRRNTLNTAAFSIGQIVGSGHLEAAMVEATLIAAGLSTGLPEDEVLTTVHAGIADGAKQPRDPKETSTSHSSGQSDETADDLHASIDMSILYPDRAQPPSFPQGVFAPCWQDWIGAAAEAKGAPCDYVAASLLGVAGALIGNSRWPSPSESWKEPPIIWPLIIGAPSSGKSPAMDAVLEPLNALEMRIQREWAEAHPVSDKGTTK